MTGTANSEPTSQLDAPVEELPGVGRRTREKLARLGVHRLCDLLFLLPLRYLDQTRVVALAEVVPESAVLVQGYVHSATAVVRRRRSLMVQIEDTTGTLLLRFFHFNYNWQRRFTPGRGIRCFGTVRPGVTPPEMIHPQCELFNPGQEPPLAEHLTPVYPGTQELRQAVLRRLISVVLHRMRADPLTDHLAGLIDGLELPDLQTALLQVHAPSPDTDPGALCTGHSPAVRRLVLEELLAHRVALLRLRQRAQQHRAPVLQEDSGLIQAFLEQLPFQLTAAQQRCCDEISADLCSQTPMTRLLQGDVGSGKTVVAAVVALRAIDSGHQAALMVPTELLAMQHHARLQQWFSRMDVPLILQTGSTPHTGRLQNHEQMRAGTPLLAVGTHALIQDDISFSRLGLAIIDEQHRFGVSQRLELVHKGTAGQPHQLIMTATPIPRTLYMALYAGLGGSVIDALPPGRQPVQTIAIDETRRGALTQRIREACLQGRQVYWVCGLIEDSDKLHKQSVSSTCAYLCEQLPELQIGVIHGRLKSAEKESVMRAFSQHKLQLLVTTTVIEVGIDVPNASLMVIENSEHLGLAQLHQLRGRIGRGSVGGDCVLLYSTPLSAVARARMEVMRRHQDGFRIAEEDLRLRGPGEILGEMQKGMPQFRIADPGRDQALLPLLDQPARQLLEHFPERIPPLLERWLGEEQEFSHA